MVIRFNHDDALSPQAGAPVRISDIRDAPETRHAARARIEGGECQTHVAKPNQLPGQIVGAAHQILIRVETLPDPQLQGRPGHQHRFQAGSVFGMPMPNSSSNAPRVTR